MKRTILAAACAMLMAAAAAADHGAPTTRPVAPPEPELKAEGESAPVELSQDGYKVALSWYPASPKPGDLVRFMARVTSPTGDVSNIVLKAGVTRAGPSAPAELMPKGKIEAESIPSDGRFTFLQVLYTDGIYRVDIELDDLAMGKSVAVKHELTIGQAHSNAAIYGVAIGGLALMVLVLAFGLRKPSETSEA